MEIITSERGRPMKVWNDFSYRIACRTRTLTEWGCSVKSCSSLMVSSFHYVHDLGSFITPSPHSHESNLKDRIKKKYIYRMKHRTKETMRLSMEMANYCSIGATEEIIVAVGKEEAVYKVLRTYKAKFINPKPNIFVVLEIEEALSKTHD